MTHDTEFLRFEMFSVYLVGVMRRNPSRTERAARRMFRKWESDRKPILDRIADDDTVRLYDSFEGLLAERDRMGLVFLLVNLLVELEKSDDR